MGSEYAPVVKLVYTMDLGAVTSVKVFDKKATVGTAAHICGRGGIGRLDGFRCCNLSEGFLIKKRRHEAAAQICGRGGIGRLDGFRFHYLSGVRVRVPPPAPSAVGHSNSAFC